MSSCFKVTTQSEVHWFDREEYRALIDGPTGILRVFSIADIGEQMTAIRPLDSEDWTAQTFTEVRKESAVPVISYSANRWLEVERVEVQDPKTFIFGSSVRRW